MPMGVLFWRKMGALKYGILTLVDSHTSSPSHACMNEPISCTVSGMAFLSPPNRSPPPPPNPPRPPPPPPNPPRLPPRGVKPPRPPRGVKPPRPLFIGVLCFVIGQARHYSGEAIAMYASLCEVVPACESMLNECNDHDRSMDGFCFCTCFVPFPQRFLIIYKEIPYSISMII